MTSNNKLFKTFLRRKSITEGKRLNDTDFIVKCRNHWKSMSEADKLCYTESTEYWRAPNPPINEVPTNQLSVDSDTTLLKEEIENKLIDGLVRYKTKEELSDTKFFFMSSNIQCKTRDEFRPLEVGLIQYTIRDGIQKAFHQFIDCGDVPLGYYSDAISHMEGSHKIPIKDFVRSSKDYLLIGSRILEVLSDSCSDQQINETFNYPMIVFSQTEQLDQNKGVLQWIAKMCNQMRRQGGYDSYTFNIKVLSATKLMSSLLMAVGDSRSMSWCEDSMKSPAFEYSVGTDCEYHESIQCIDCAIGVPKRMAYLMSHFLQKSYSIQISDNHLPTIVRRLESLRITGRVQNHRLCTQKLRPIEDNERNSAAESHQIVKEVKKVPNEEVVEKQVLERIKAKPMEQKPPILSKTLLIGFGRGKRITK